MNLKNFEKMTEYAFNQGIDQITLTITKAETNDYFFQVDTIKNDGPKYTTKSGSDFDLDGAIKDWLNRE